MAIFLGAGGLVCLCLFSLKLADSIRSQGFARLSREAAPLVEAINAYYTENGLAPERLDALQVIYPPGHIIKGEKLPDFEYVTGSLAREHYHGNPWVLTLKTPTGPLRWDQFIYYPLQNYPSLGHGGWLEKVGSWAYVHE